MGNPCPEHLSPLPLRTKISLGRTRAEQTCCVPFQLQVQPRYSGSPTRARVRNRPAVSLLELQVQPRYSGSPTRAHACGTDLLCPFFNCKRKRLPLGSSHARTRAVQTCCVPFSTASVNDCHSEAHTRRRGQTRSLNTFPVPPSGAKGLVGGA